MIFLVTDFGNDGPYLGQVAAVLARQAQGIPVISLFNDVPSFAPCGAAYLLAAYATVAQPGDVVLAVVDPGVGTARRPLVVRADGCWYVGPDNGLLAIVARRAKAVESWEIGWRPLELSNTFHGRDLFAPVAARLAVEGEPGLTPLALKPVSLTEGKGWPDDYGKVVYFDRYGNAMTGCRACNLGHDKVGMVGGQRLTYAKTFGDRPPGEAFWYENANGLAEIAVSRGSARQVLGLSLGDTIIWH